MKTIAALIEAVSTDHLRLGENSDDVKLRGPVLSLNSDGTPIVYCSAWGGPRRRQEAENALKLFKLMIEKALDDDDLNNRESGIDEERIQSLLEIIHGKQKSLESQENHITKLEKAIYQIASSDVTNVRQAKEIADSVRT